MIGKNEVYIVLDNIKYAQNIGSIFRVADAFGVKKIYLCRNNRQRLNPNQKRILYKASRGATDWVEWEFRNSCIEVIKELKNENIKLIGIETGNDSIPIDQIGNIKLVSPLALVFGSEDDGISSDVLEIMDHLVKIPMQGRGRSLNVSTSLSIAVYEIFKSLKEN